MPQQPEKADFVSLLTSHQRRIFGYLATLLPNPADTEEVLQQTNAILWAKADEYQPGTSFKAWSFKVAYFEALAFQRKQSQDRRLFSRELIDTMSAEMSSFDSEPAITALQRCLEKLSAPEREIISRRYQSETTVEQIATALNRPVSSIYRSLNRIRLALLQCIQRTLAAEERS